MWPLSMACRAHVEPHIHWPQPHLLLKELAWEGRGGVLPCAQEGEESGPGHCCPALLLPVLALRGLAFQGITQPQCGCSCQAISILGCKFNRACGLQIIIPPPPHPHKHTLGFWSLLEKSFRSLLVWEPKASRISAKLCKGRNL